MFLTKERMIMAAMGMREEIRVPRIVAMRWK